MVSKTYCDICEKEIKEKLLYDIDPLTTREKEEYDSLKNKLKLKCNAIHLMASSARLEKPEFEAREVCKECIGKVEDYIKQMKGGSS